MRILELHLKAFGAFTDRAPIELPDVDGPGLCVVYGRNEAGKSTALRAIRGLLYGFPTQLSDDFLHRYADLRVGARLRFDDGEELAAMRHKKKKDSLYTYDDLEVIQSSRLDALVEAIPEALFERFYGLDHAGLREGSAALLEDEGEVGRALFGAGLGVSNLASVIGGLEGEAAALFVPRGSKPKLNLGLADWSKAYKEIGQSALDPQVWAAQEQRVRETEARVEGLRSEIAEARREFSRLERWKGSLPGLARRAGARETLERLANIAVLPDDFADRLTGARAERRSAEHARLRAEAKIERETAAQETLSLAPELVAEQDRIDSLHQRVGAYQEALDQLPRRESKLAALNEEIESLLVGEGEIDSSPERAAALRQAVGRTGSIRTLANEGLKLEERQAKAREEAAEAKAELERLTKNAVAAPESEFDAAPLRGALARALKLGSLDEGIAEERHASEALDFELERRGRALGIRDDEIANIEDGAVPSHEWIDSMSERFATQARRREGLRDEIEKVRAERRAVDEALAKMQSQGAVPRLVDLEDRRGDRDHVWRELRRGLVEADEAMEAAAASGLADRFEREVAAADALGDRLRVDATRVAERGALEARATRLELDGADLLERERGVAEEQVALESQWSSGWAPTGVVARSPEEMRGWRRAFDECLSMLGQRREAARSVERKETARRDAIAAFRDALATFPGGVDFHSDRIDEWIAHADALLERLNGEAELRRRDAEARRQAEERLAQSELRAQHAVGAASEWRERWDAAIGFLDLPEQARPDRALERLDEMARLQERLRERDETADRIGKMRSNIATFEEEVRKLVELCSVGLSGESPAPGRPTLAEEPPGVATQRLQRRLGEALNQQSLFGKCQEALAEAGEERDEASARIASSEQAIESLCALAGVEDESSLDEALRLWREVEEATASLRQAESDLTNLAEGRTLDDLEAETRGLDVDDLAARIASLAEHIDRKAHEEATANQDLRSERDALEAMDGTGRVAELAGAAEAKLAEIWRDVDRYVELRLAKQLLETEIDRYRQENQAPLLKRSGEIFAALTLGAYPRIETELDDSGREVRLVAVDRAAKRRVPVTGLSNGTRDQLFLAIRLASLEEAMARHERMPLIADDILIEFDDERSRACLEVLSEMGRENQILLFSHHEHIAEIARDLGPRASVIEL